jgi:hypothetical protein
MYEYSDEAKALHAEIAAAREDLKKARIYWNNSTSPATVAKWNARWQEASDRIKIAQAALQDGRRAEVRALTDEALARRLAEALNDAYVARVGDYSSDSISRADQDVDDALAILEERGLTKDEVIVYVKDGPRSGWAPRSEVTTVVAR